MHSTCCHPGPPSPNKFHPFETSQAKYVVRILATITTHPAVYSALALVEDIWNNERVAAAESILDRVITADRVAWFVSVLDDTFTPERIRKVR